MARAACIPLLFCFMIRTISLINCQSWDNGTIELATDRVNVLQAPNNAGKSVLFKMLKITANPKAYTASQRRELIRWETNGAIILFTFEDGTAGYTQVLPTGVSYFYNGNMYATPPEEYLANIGLLTNNGMIANLMDATQELLLVNPALSANYDLMQLLVHNDHMENIRENTEKNLKTYNIKSGMLSMVAGVLENQLKQYQYTDIEKRTRDLEVGELCYHMIYDVMIPVAKEIVNLTPVEQQHDFQSLQHIYAVLEQLASVKFEELETKIFNKQLWGIFHVAEDLNALPLKDMGVSGFDSSLADVFDAWSKLAELDLYNVFVETPKDCTQIYEALLMFENLNLDAVTYIDGIADNIKALKQQLQDMKAVQECPIYGNVIYDGESCQPYGGSEA